MARKIRKNIALENRRKELDEELRATRRDLRRLRRGESLLPDPVAVLRRLWPASEEPAHRPPAPSARAAGPAENGKTADPSRPSEPEGGRGGGGGAIQRGDARFASYFVTGGLHGLEPQHHERPILRNRMIVWGVLVFFVLITVYVIFF